MPRSGMRKNRKCHICSFWVTMKWQQSRFHYAHGTEANKTIFHWRRSLHEQRIGLPKELQSCKISLDRERRRSFDRSRSILLKSYRQKIKPGGVFTDSLLVSF